MKKLVQIVFACCLILCVSCEKEGLSPLEQIQAGAPVVTDQAASVTEISVVLYGYVNPQYLMMGGEFGFIISTSPSPSLNNGKKFSSNEIDLNGRYSVALTNLSSSTKYYFKSYVTSGTSYLEGEAKSFTTKKLQTSGAVDMGLSVKWATRNLGASKPEEYGGYYQWAGTRDESDTSIDLYWDNCPYHTGSSSSSGWTKYNIKSSYGTVDNKTTLEASDDAAAVNLGGKWRMPTDAEWTELRNSCSWTWTSLNGIEGCMVTSKKNGNGIFLPAAGVRNDDLRGVGSHGFYWSSSLNTDNPFSAYGVYFRSGGVDRYSRGRFEGISVRPVTE